MRRVACEAENVSLACADRIDVSSGHITSLANAAARQDWLERATTVARPTVAVEQEPASTMLVRRRQKLRQPLGGPNTVAATKADDIYRSARTSHGANRFDFRSCGIWNAMYGRWRAVQLALQYLVGPHQQRQLADVEHRMHTCQVGVADVERSEHLLPEPTLSSS